MSDVIKEYLEQLDEMGIDDRIEKINELRELIHEHSPFKKEPVDFVKWVKSDSVHSNDYNPNNVAPTEMKLLRQSILSDGYTQPIVSWPQNGSYEVVDGWHRNRVGKECDDVKVRILGYLPVTIINESQEGKGDRIASTIRHNRARGKHAIDGMSEIVLELKNRNWSNERISRDLGMEQDEILRLCQITGLSGLFSDKDFSKSWDIEDSESDSVTEEFIPVTDDVKEIAEQAMLHGFRSGNTSDEGRMFHTWEKWECYKAGFYATTMEGVKKDEAEKMYADFLSDNKLFADTLSNVITEWKYSCEHYLTNNSLNRIAWLGQASASYAKGLPAVYRGGFNLLTQEQQDTANKTACEYLNKWLVNNGRDEISLEEALSGKQVDLY